MLGEGERGQCEVAEGGGRGKGIVKGEGVAVGSSVQEIGSEIAVDTGLRIKSLFGSFTMNNAH